MQSVINRSYSFDPILALLFFMVITVTNISSINIHQTFYTHTQDIHTYMQMHLFLTRTNLQSRKKRLIYDVSAALHSTKAWQYCRCFPSPPPTSSLPLCLMTLAAFGGIMGKCHTSRIIVYLLCSLHLTSPRLASSAHLRATLLHHTDLMEDW